MGNRVKRPTVACAVLFGLALLASLVSGPAVAQFTAAQKAACATDAKRFCSRSMANSQKLAACMQSNASRLQHVPIIVVHSLHA
jgi:hypothetical protein